ncbi:SMP-30/gluconolactonase/LRE family protein [Sandaracinobacteroides saxicola]|uniref:SMP-30/gluconolactonase/LRE family protein n=1 Tax=Sandaracinobacteroides saxicola TaxID=2759707 RepID=A0A7G5IHB6_9SPHN|nr:SMP-30/gluconolactonase/LRE family protein [Sandaracinobacteroides saxicola]QMW22758.1 SMP-30/gluconolactonase/LRE family protein [Sandaracinobacteroides saxicola]
MSDINIIAEGLAFPEGPVFMDDGSIIVCEIAAGRITRVRRDGTTHVIATPGGGPNGAAIGPDGALWVCNNGGFNWATIDGMLIPGAQADDYETGRIERIDLSTGRVERVYQTVNGHNLSGPNDLMFDAAGGFWFSDHAKIRARESDHGGLFYGRSDGSLVKQAVYPLDHPNGVGLSPDGWTVHVALTMQRLILSFEITGEGEVAPSPLAAVPGRVAASFPGRVLLDSLAMFADGDIAQATLVERPGIATVNPATGDVSYRDFPDLLTTNIAFGGADMREAAVCLSTTGRLAMTRFDKPGLRLAFNG